jgi:hypothetical protein
MTWIKMVLETSVILKEFTPKIAREDLITPVYWQENLYLFLEVIYCLFQIIVLSI